MKINHYLIGALPDLDWNTRPEKSLEDFLEENHVMFEPYEEELREILFLNEIRNIELLLKYRVDLKNGKISSEDAAEYPIELFKPNIVSRKFLDKFIDQPFVWLPDEYNMFMVDFFEKYTELESRYKNIEELYVAYFRYLEEHSNSFFRFYGRTFSTLFTIVSAYRIIEAGKDLEACLKGDPIIVKTILDNRSTTDLGLKTVFWQMPEVMALLEKGPLDLEHDFDKLVFHLLEEVGQEVPFGDHVIFSYIIKYFILDRWNTMSPEKGNEILENIISG